jgi:hypothetical protein
MGGVNPGDDTAELGAVEPSRPVGSMDLRYSVIVDWPRWKFSAEVEPEREPDGRQAFAFAGYAQRKEGSTRREVSGRLVLDLRSGGSPLDQLRWGADGLGHLAGQTVRNIGGLGLVADLLGRGQQFVGQLVGQVVEVHHVDGKVTKITKVTADLRFERLPDHDPAAVILRITQGTRRPGRNRG